MKIAIQIGTNDARDEVFPILTKARYDKIYLIEPHTICNESIKYMYSGENYEIINMAITPNPEIKETELYLFSNNGQHDSLLFRKTHVWREERDEIKSITVPCMTFMNLCEWKKIKEVDYLCVDTEGLDPEILNSIDYEKIKIRKIRWESWLHIKDDENERYRSGRPIELELITKLTKNGYSITMEDDVNYCAIMHPDRESLPWINIEDKNHIGEAIKYIPEKAIIIEAGTCAAEDTLRFKERLPHSIIHTFEPNRNLFKISVENIRKKYGEIDYPLVDNIHRWKTAKIYIYPLALTNVISTVTFYESEFPHTSSLYENNFKNIKVPDTVLKSLNVEKQSDLKIWKEEPITIQGITIDGWAKLENIETVDYLWLDTEGAELLILKGAKDMLPRMKAISLELNFQEFRKGIPLFNEIYDYLFTRGFELKAIWQAHQNWQANGIFVRR